MLDLGCGRGHWLLDAADFWFYTEFIGFDLVDILLPEVEQKANVRLVRGNLYAVSSLFDVISDELQRQISFTISGQKL